jgi:flagellar hook-length control protein FliK
LETRRKARIAAILANAGKSGSSERLDGPQANQQEPSKDLAQELAAVAGSNLESSDGSTAQSSPEPPAIEDNALANIELPRVDIATAAIAGSADAVQGGITTAGSTNGDSSATAVNSVSSGAERRSAATSAAKSQAPGDSVDLTQQERVRLVQRVARSFSRIGPEGGQINLRLHPPQLGSLNVQVRLEGRSMTANLTTESSAARDVILESLPVLRSRLAEQGFEIAHFQVDVAANGSDASQGGNSDPNYEPNNKERDSHYNFRPTRSANGSVESPPPPRLGRESLVWQATTGIDIHA